MEIESSKKTEQVTPQGQLHFQPEWCRVTLASIGDAVITTDNEGRVTFLNPVAESLTGWPLQEATGVDLESIFKIINQGNRQKVESPTVRALRDGVVVGLANHTLLISKDGTERPIDDSAAPIRNDKGEVAGVVLIFRDISERYEQEQKVQDALSYADNIIATVRESLIILDKNLRVHTANQTFYQTFHVSKQDTENTEIFALGNGQWNIPKLRELLKEIIPQHSSFQDFEIEHDFPILGKRIMRLNARRFVPINSLPELILLAIEDITERRQAEAKMKASESRYRRLFESAKDGILILDSRTGTIIDSNPFMSDSIGYSHDEFLGKQLWEIGLFKDRSENEAAFEQLQRKGYIRYDHLPLATKTGKQVEVEFVSNAYREDGNVVIQCNIRDITAHRQLERTKAIADALSDLHRRKDEFLAMLSHELRNPLAPIANAVQLLRLQKTENSIQQQAREIIDRQLGQMTRLVDELLEVSRITTGRIHLQQENLDLRGIIERAVEATRSLIGFRHHTLHMRLPSEPVWLHADATRLEQVMVNLLNNAVKYSEDRSQIWVGLDLEGGEAVIRVRDSGVGIAPEILPRIFDLFTQAERSLARSQGGLGIGLSLVQRLVEMHGGRVEAHSSLGQGSEFVVRLPVVPSPEHPPPTATVEAMEPTGTSLRVLVVDDNNDAAQSLAMLLRQLEHDVRTAYDGPTAVQAALNYQPDLVFLDIGLPELDGFEVAKRIRQQPVHKRVVLVALTGYGQESDQQRSQNAGFDYHLVKPADFVKVRDILTTVAKKAN